VTEGDSKIKDNLLIIIVVAIQVLNSVLVVVPQIPLVAKQAVSFVIPFVMITLIMVIDYAYRVAASQYYYIEQQTRSLTGGQKKLHLFIKEPSEGFSSVIVNPSEEDWYETTVELGEAVIYGIYKNVTKITYEHQLLWNERIADTPAKALYKGYRVPHNKCAFLTAWEPRENFHTQDHLEDHLRFIISEAPRDIYLQSRPISVDEKKYVVTTECPSCNKEVTYETLSDVVAKDCVKCPERAKTLSFESKYATAQQKTLRLEQLVIDLKKHLKAAMSRTDVSKLALETLVTLIAAHGTLTGAKKELSATFFKFTPLIIVGAITGLCILAFSVVPDFRAWASANPILVIAGIGMVMGVSYFMLKRKGG